MLEVSAHLAAAAASLVTVGWRLSTETKKYEREWWMFMAGQMANVGFQLAMVERFLWWK